MNYTKIGIIGLITITFVVLGFQFSSFSNTEVELKNQFKEKMDARTTFYDNMWKTINQKAKVAVKNDSSYTNTVNAIMASRADAPNLFMKWVQESNPNANFSEVSGMYKDLSRTIEAKRDEFVEIERTTQDVVMVHNNHLETFPNSLFNMILNRPHLVYKPISSDRTDEVMKTSKDNDVSVF